MSAVVPLAAFPIDEMLVFLFSVLGSLVFVGLALCVRRFDAEQGTDDGGGGGGGRRGPDPSRPAGPLAAIDPPLGEIRAKRRRPPSKRSRERRERIAS